MNWKWLIPPACLILGGAPSYGQSKDSIITNIRSLFRSINSDTSLRTIQLEQEEFDDEVIDGGSSLKGYFKGDTLVKMHLWEGVSYCVRQYDYYFVDGRSFFIYETEEDYPVGTSGSMNYTKLKLVFEGRYYLDNGELVDMKVKGKKKMEEMPTRTFVIRLINESKKFAKALRARYRKTRPELAKPA